MVARDWAQPNANTVSGTMSALHGLHNIKVDITVAILVFPTVC